MPKGNVRTRNLRRLVATLPVRSLPLTAQAKMRTVPVNSASAPTEFQFPFVPIQISYENLAPELVEIDRPQNLPYVDRKGYKLLRVNLQFLLARPFDGFSQSVDADIRILRSMANSSDPVVFSNMDGMLTNPFNIPQLGINRSNTAFFFRIGELSVQSVRRNRSNEITAAEISITLVEDANSRAQVISFPAIQYPDLVKPSTKASNNKPKDPAPPSYQQTVVNVKTSKTATKVTGGGGSAMGAKYK